MAAASRQWNGCILNNCVWGASYSHSFADLSNPGVSTAGSTWLRERWPAVASGDIASASWQDLSNSLTHIQDVLHEVEQRIASKGAAVSNLGKFERRVKGFKREGRLRSGTDLHPGNGADPKWHHKLQGARNNVAGVHVALPCLDRLKCTRAQCSSVLHTGNLHVRIGARFWVRRCHAGLFFGCAVTCYCAQLMVLRC
jgi:hypothetical protein